jgi:hypothetical protein
MNGRTADAHHRCVELSLNKPLHRRRLVHLTSLPRPRRSSVRITVLDNCCQTIIASDQKREWIKFLVLDQSRGRALLGRLVCISVSGGRCYRSRRRKGREVGTDV